MADVMVDGKTVNVRKFNPQIIFKVKITTEFVWRLRISKMLIRLAGWVLGAKIEFVEGDNASV